MKPFKRLHTHFIVWLTILVIVGPYVAKNYLIIQFQWNKSDIITTSCIQRNNEESSILWMNNYDPSVDAPMQSIDGLFLPFKLKPSDYHSTIEHPPC